MRKEDMPLIADMCWRKWASNEVKQKPDVAINYGYMVLYDELIHHSAAFVADEDGKAVGVLILSILDEHKFHEEYLIKMTEAALKLSRDPDGNRNLKHSVGVMKVFNDSEKVLEGMGIGAEVALFINDSWHRRQGVGSGMFKHMATYLHEHGVKRFFLHTDECSNHQFYGEHRGMKQIDRRETGVDLGDVKGVTLYMYADDVENQMHD